MATSVALVAYLVRDYDEAIAYFTTILGFELLEDTPRLGEAPGKRWVRVAPPRDGAGCVRGAALLLARATTPEQAAQVGRQAGGRVWLFLETDDFARTYGTLRARGVDFTESPREEAYGTVAVFCDLYGNRWDLIQHRDARGGTESLP